MINTQTSNNLHSLLNYYDGGFTHTLDLELAISDKSIGSDNGVELFTVYPTIEAVRYPSSGIALAAAMELTEVKVLIPTDWFYDDEEEIDTDLEIINNWAVEAIEEALGVSAEIITDWECARYYEQAATFKLLTPVRYQQDNYEELVAECVRSTLRETYYTEEEARAYVMM